MDTSIVQPAGHLVGAGRDQFGALAQATLKSFGATGVESTTARNGVQSGHGAIDLVQVFAVTFHVGDRGHQARGVGVSRVVDDLVHRADFGHAPRIQNRHNGRRFRQSRPCHA